MRCGTNTAFGYIERKHNVREPRAAAAYLSSYFIADKGSKIGLEESVQSNWMPRSIIHVSVELTRQSQVTMRNLRLRRYAWVLWRQLPDFLLIGTAIDQARSISGCEKAKRYGRS